MNALETFRALGPIDAKNVARDPMLGWLLGFGIGIGLLLRWATPALSGYLDAKYQFDLTAYYVLIVSVAVQVVPVIVGTVIGFLLLDQRDDRTLDALQVTPMTTRGYVFYRIWTPLVLSTVISVVMVLIADLVEVDVLPLTFLCIAAAPLAPLFALCLGTIAQNKVQGFALSKVNGIITAPPVAAYFVAGGWQLAFGIVPTYWPAKAFWMYADADPMFWLFLVIGFAYQLALTWVLARYFERVVCR